MRGFEVKKLVAIAAGAAMVGTALAPFALAAAPTKADLYDLASGQPKINVAVGSKAALSDAVWAGNIAAKLAEKATVKKTAAASGAAGTAKAEVKDKSVDLVVGGKVVFGAGSKEVKVAMDSASATGATQRELDLNAFTSSTLTHLYNTSLSEKRAGSNYSITVQEQVYLTADAKFDTTTGITDFVATVDPGWMEYRIDYGTGVELDESSSTAYNDSGSSDLVKTPLFGDLYEINKVDFNSATANIKFVKSAATLKVLKGEEIKDLVGDNTYAGQAMSVKFLEVVKSGTTLNGVFELYDKDGKLVDRRTVAASSNLKDSFVDKTSKAAL